MGGDYPRLRFFLYLVRHIMIACNYTRLWREYARERRNLGTKILNSLTGRYDTDIFSAHNIFENMHHRAMVAAFKNKAEQMQAIGQIKDSTLLSLLAEGGGLSQVLEMEPFSPVRPGPGPVTAIAGAKAYPHRFPAMWKRSGSITIFWKPYSRIWAMSWSRSSKW